MSGVDQTCPGCGRSEAAGDTCSWCGRRIQPEDQYSPGNFPAHYQEARIPKEVPDDPPPEFRTPLDWPTGWGPCPYTKGRRNKLGAQGGPKRR